MVYMIRCWHGLACGRVVVHMIIERFLSIIFHALPITYTPHIHLTYLRTSLTYIVHSNFAQDANRRREGCTTRKRSHQLRPFPNQMNTEP